MILAVGERFNGEPYDLGDSFELRLQIGIYNYGSRKDFLDRMGIHWDHGLNLLWSCLTPGEWDTDEARRVAEVVIMPHCDRYDRVILFGERVCDAFDVPYKMGLIFGNFIPLHHPLGDCSHWNKNFIRSVLE